MKSQGKKEVLEAVLIAALVTTVTGLIGWGLEHLKSQFKKPSPDDDQDDNEDKVNTDKE